MKRSLAAVALVAGCLVLAACTAPISYGVRLNADGAVDYANCSPGLASHEVDYHVGDGAGVVEWTLTPGIDADLPHAVIEYGVEPDGFTGVALPPPRNWTTVDVGFAHVDRTDLIVDEWVWEDNNFEWIPGQPCMDVD